jgi:hypothetical protein
MTLQEEFTKQLNELNEVLYQWNSGGGGGSTQHKMISNPTKDNIISSPTTPH